MCVCVCGGQTSNNICAAYGHVTRARERPLLVQVITQRQREGSGSSQQPLRPEKRFQVAESAFSRSDFSHHPRRQPPVSASSAEHPRVGDDARDGAVTSSAVWRRPGESRATAADKRRRRTHGGLQMTGEIRTCVGGERWHSDGVRSVHRGRAVCSATAAPE